jgi:thiol-disulfide isomerase/thioredoxin
MIRSNLMRFLFAGVGVVLLAIHPPVIGADFSRGDDRLGVTAPPLNLKHWLHSPPLEMQALRGKVVLLRWWTEGCPYCVATAPALRQLDRKYGSRGLAVIGIFHPKPAGDWSVERMRVASDRLGLTFPIALDGDWSALRRWWPELERREWTSVSFVVDRKGIIRYVHPGGEFHEGQAGESHARCERDYKEIEQVIGRLLAE